MTLADRNGNLHSTDGRFTEKQHSAPVGELIDLDFGKSFLFPPARFRTAGEMVGHFVSTPVSDQVLSNISHAYTNWVEKGAEDAGRAAVFAFENDPRAVRPYVRDPAALQQASRAVYEQAAEAVRQSVPLRQLSSGDARSIAIAMQMELYRDAIDDLQGQDTSFIMQTRLPTFHGPQTAADIYATLRCREWTRRALTESDLKAADASHDVMRALRHQRESELLGRLVA